MAYGTPSHILLARVGHMIEPNSGAGTCTLTVHSPSTRASICQWRGKGETMIGDNVIYLNGIADQRTLSEVTAFFRKF